MTNMNRDMGTDDKKIVEFVDRLAKDRFLIPTFQRDFMTSPWQANYDLSQIQPLPTMLEVGV